MELANAPPNRPSDGTAAEDFQLAQKALVSALLAGADTGPARTALEEARNRAGIRDRAMLHLCYAAGLRVSELVGLRLDDLTLQPQPSIVVHGKGRKERSLPRRHAPTALLCFNDPIAFGAMLGRRSIGQEPDTDCWVVGMDDVSEVALWQPGLITVSIGRDTIGRSAGRLLMDRREAPDRVAAGPRLTHSPGCRKPTGGHWKFLPALGLRSDGMGQPNVGIWVNNASAPTLRVVLRGSC